MTLASLPLLLATAAPDPAPLFPTGSTDSGGGGVFLPALVLAILAGVAFYLSKKKRQGGGNLEVLESASLGLKRSILLVRVKDEILVLGSSEAGISLLSKQPVGDVSRQPPGDDFGRTLSLAERREAETRSA